MNFHNFQSLIASQKQGFKMRTAMDSFSIAPQRTDPYIDPTFTKSEFSVEKPQVVLVSAVGATGKSALAQVLSSRLQLPLLNLGRHKPVGDNTLTGLLTNAFEIDQLSPIFKAIATGRYGVIVDGIDEGRSKTTEQAFQAFLDDIARLCGGAQSTSFVLLGRTQVLEEYWVYLTDKGISTGLLTIDPFDLDQARSYIDSFTDGLTSAQALQYGEARDVILGKLSNAFSASDADRADNFLSFIGYPPVLDAIVTLLHEEHNYHRLKEELGESASSNVEIGLLHRIAVYILDRERSEKVLPNIVEPLIVDLPANDASAVREGIFSIEEQCVRLVSHCLNESLSLDNIAQPLLNARYEEQLATFLPEHPFVTGRTFRNAIFEAVALALLITAEELRYQELALRYVDSHRHSYYLVYLLALVAPDGKVPLGCLRALLGAALEFKATNASVELRVLGPDPEETRNPDAIDIEVELTIGTTSEQSKTFSFQSVLSPGDPVHLGYRLSAAYVSLPSEVILGGSRETELTAPVEIRADVISLTSPLLMLRTQAAANSEKHIILEATRVNSGVTNLTAMGVDFTIAVEEMRGLQYPLVQHARQKGKPPQDVSSREKYLRLRKILTHFRSHSKGALAKYRDKIENPRVAGNAIGRAVLSRLIQDGVLRIDGTFYFLQPERVDTYLGISWTDLRKGETSEKLLQYLRSIGV
jgi:hypothetical protein